MAIKIRRGLEADRTSVIFEEGEVLYTTDTKSFFIGDGVTAGGNQIGGTTAASLLKTTVHNATGVTLTKGQVVYLNGNTGNKPNAVLAQADSEATSSKTIGLIITNISNNANGDIATDGLISDLNTSAFAAGDLLWLSDSVAGGVTTIMPDTPNNSVFIGYVVETHPTQGKILIHIQNGYELNELHDVKITSVQNNDGLIYDSTLGYWKNSNTVTVQGNTFNAANKLVQLDATAKLPAVDGSQLTNLPSFTPPNGLLKIASAISTTFQAVTDYLGNVTVLFLNSRRVGIGKDTSVTTQSVAIVEVQDANTSIVLKPNGTGAIIASVPDGVILGGNPRGTYSVDLQLNRNAATQVASGGWATIIGGFGNTASANASIAGGDACTSSGLRAVSFGQSNTASSNYSATLSGQSNTASTNTHATVVGGQSNTSSGQHSVSGGNTNTASGESAVTLGRSNIASGQKAISIGFNNNNSTAYGVAIGSDNTVAQAGGQFFGFAIGQGNSISSASGSRSYVFGESNVMSSNGIRNTAIGYGSAVIGTANNAMAINSGQSEANYNLAKGLYSRGYLYNAETRGGGINWGGTLGTTQITTCIASKLDILTTAATTILSLDGTGTTNLIIPNGNNRAWNVQIDTIAVVTAITGTATGVSVGDCYRETKQLLFKRIGGTSSIVGSVDTTAIKNDTSMSTAAITITAGASQQMAITFTAPTFAGGGSVTCRVVSKVSLVEVAY